MYEPTALDPRQAKQYSPLSLAFLGDAVYEQQIREKLMLEANMPVRRLHALAVRYVCASFQAKAAEALLPLFSEEEADIYRRGRNCTSNTVPRSADPADYHRATGLEALFGYLHLTGNCGRVRELAGLIWSMDAKGEDVCGKS